MKKFILVILLIFISSFVNAEELKIFSDQLQINRNEKISTFTGNVHVIGKQFELWSDKLLVKTNEDESQIKEILAFNRVRINRDNTLATGENASYFPEMNTLYIRGDVEVIENNNTVYCSELIIDIENSSSIMTGGSTNRVEALIFSN